MKFIRFTSFILLIIAHGFVHSNAQGRGDIVVMKNGDRITCEIVSLDGGVLSVKLDYAEGTISLQWSKVERIESTRLFIVKTDRGVAHSGTLSTAAADSGKPVTIEVAKAANIKVEIDSKEVVAIERTARSFWKRFNGDISVGVSYAKGNRSTQYNLASSIEYPRDKWNLKASFASDLSSNASSDTVSRNNLNISASRLLRWNKYFVTSGVSLLESSEQEIGLQSTLSGGLGYQFKNSNRAKIALAGGLAWQSTNYTGFGTGRDTQNVTVGIVTADLQFFKFKKTKFDLQATMLPSISEPGRFYFRLNQSYHVKLYRNFSWNISFYGNWDNRPPIGLSGSDYGTTTGLGWTFGNR